MLRGRGRTAVRVLVFLGIWVVWTVVTLLVMAAVK